MVDDARSAASAGVARTRTHRLGLAVGLNVGIVVVQVVFGLIAHSLGLLADAGHNLTDVVAVVASLVAVRWSMRLPTGERSYGYHRGTILAALGNAGSILAVTLLIAYEGVRRLLHPEPVTGGVVVMVALAGTVVNGISALVLREGHDRAHDHSHGSGAARGHAGHGGDLNMRSALLHMTADAVASLGVAVAGAVILLTGRFFWLDPAVSLGIGLLIAVQAWGLLQAAVHVLLESTPAGLDVDQLVRAMAGVAGVEEVHDLHVWSLSSEVRALSAHVVLLGHPTLEEAQTVSVDIKRAISGPFAIAHATLELECEACVDDGSWCAMDLRASVDDGPLLHGH